MEGRRDKSIKIDYVSCAILPLPEMGIKRSKQMSKFILLFREIDYDRRHFCTTTINNDSNHCKHINQVNRLKLAFWFLPMLNLPLVEHLKVLNGTNRCNGRVEIYHDGHWKRTCNSDWGKEQAAVVCREMNCGSPVVQPIYPTLGDSSNLNGVKITCTGNETSISQCAIQEFKERCTDASVFCSGMSLLIHTWDANSFIPSLRRLSICLDIYFIHSIDSKQLRLVNGTHRCSGRVEIFHDGMWGTVCDDKWGMQEVAVTCRELNCGTSVAAKYKSFFGRGHDQVWLDDVDCTGDEKYLIDCRHRGLGEHDCDHNEDAGLICSGTTSYTPVNPG